MLGIYFLLTLFSLVLCGCSQNVSAATETIYIDARNSTAQIGAPMQDGTYKVRREVSEITVFPFDQQTLEQAKTAVDTYISIFSAEPGTLSFEIEKIAFDPIMTDVKIQQFIADSAMPQWDIAQHYTNTICYAVTYSATYDHSKSPLPDAQHETIQIVLIRQDTESPWSILSHGVPVEAHSHQALSSEELLAFYDLSYRVLAGYQVDQEFWLYVQEEGSAAVSRLILPRRTVWDESEVESDTPVTPQPGDTQYTWNPTVSIQFPADSVCSCEELLEKWMAVEGLTYDTLNDLACKQLILVSASGGNQAVVHCYYRNDLCSTFTPLEDLCAINGWVGANGIRHGRMRNTLTSPAGLWSLGLAFGNAEKPEGVSMPWRSVTPESDWVCDAGSVYFNTWQERNDESLSETWDHTDSEHLADYTSQYAYACVIRYNTPPYCVPERGCAIFLHCSTGPTEGCIGVPEKSMVRILQWLEAKCHPHILISGEETAE